VSCCVVFSLAVLFSLNFQALAIHFALLKQTYIMATYVLKERTNTSIRYCTSCVH
jgi:hypothetical protein